MTELAIVHRHREADTDARETNEQVLVVSTSRQYAHVVSEDQDHSHGHQPEHQGDVPRWGWSLLLESRRFVRRWSSAFVGLLAAF